MSPSSADPPRTRHVAAALAACLLALAAPAAVLAGSSTGIGFRSVAAARAALAARADVERRRTSGWMVLRETGAPGRTEWAFVGADHAAHPALVRRDVTLKGGLPTLVTRFLCEGRRNACEALYARLRAHGESTATSAWPDIAP
ncbi:MAG: hypothetical protein RLW61_13220 [Gammaproteobacteria bacterium]